MDPTRFDALTRAVRTRHARRGAVATLLGGAAGLLWVGSPAAKKKGKKKGCKAGTKKCGSACIPPTACCTANECDRCARESCQGGVCDCAAGFIRSNGVCGRFLACKSTGELTTDAADCCSGESIIEVDSGQERCLPGTFLCITPIDCVGGGPCRGFMCPKQYQSVVGGGC